MDSIDSTLLFTIVVAAVVWALYELHTQDPIDTVVDKGAASLIIPEEKINIDNIDRLSRYATREEYKNPLVLSDIVGSHRNNHDKIQSILDINKNIKNTNYNYMVNELSREDYVDSSTEQWRKKIFTEYVFQ